MSRTFMEIMTDLDNIKEELDKKIFNEVVAKPKASEWIPVTERLPEPRNEMVRRDVYLVTVKEGLVFTRTFVFDTRGGYWENGLEVIAWMPLPEPYREDGE